VKGMEGFCGRNGPPGVGGVASAAGDEWRTACPPARDPLLMTEPERIQFMHGYPIPTRDHAALLASHRLLLDAARECLPVSVTPRGETTFFEDWEITRAAFMARMAGTVRHLSYLAPSYSRLDGFALARTLVDHVITFAWISADPKERLPAFLRDSFENLLRKGRALSEPRGQGAPPRCGASASERVHRAGRTRDARPSRSLGEGQRRLARAGPVVVARAAPHPRPQAHVPRRLRPLLGLRPPDDGASRSSSTWPATRSSQPSTASRYAIARRTCAPTGSRCSRSPRPWSSRTWHPADRASKPCGRPSGPSARCASSNGRSGSPSPRARTAGSTSASRARTTTPRRPRATSRAARPLLLPCRASRSTLRTSSGGTGASASSSRRGTACGHEDQAHVAACAVVRSADRADDPG